MTGLAALVAAPAVIRIAPLMPISSRWMPLYVPIQWLDEEVVVAAMANRHLLKPHAWPRPLADNWINLHDYDPAYVRNWLRQGRNDDPDYGVRFF
jgi:hypothetical protein